MKFAGYDLYIIILHSIDKPMFAGYPSAPISFEFML